MPSVEIFTVYISYNANKLFRLTYFYDRPHLFCGLTSLRYATMQATGTATRRHCLLEADACSFVMGQIYPRKSNPEEHHKSITIVNLILAHAAHV
jgi:hypothetical protein